MPAPLRSGIFPHRRVAISSGFIAEPLTTHKQRIVDMLPKDIDPSGSTDNVTWRLAIGGDE